MPQKQKAYEEVTEGRQLVKDLCEKYSDELWAVSEPSTIMVMGIVNKDRAKRNKTMAKIVPVKAAERAVFKLNDITIQYIIELYWSDWNQWPLVLKQWVIFHELQHVADEAAKTVKHDCEDFRMIIDKIGVGWMADPSKLPNMLNEKVEFNLDLRANMIEYCEKNELPSEPATPKEPDFE